jgi:hypothetical protein
VEERQREVPDPRDPFLDAIVLLGRDDVRARIEKGDLSDLAALGDAERDAIVALARHGDDRTTSFTADLRCDGRSSR